MIHLRTVIRLIFVLILGILFLFLINFAQIDLTRRVIGKGYFNFRDFAPNIIYQKTDRGLIYGNILAEEDYLGTIEVRFDNFTNIRYGLITFKIKEPASDLWYSENTYTTKVFDELPLYPFGFPVISNSKNKEYYFEFEIKDAELGKDIVLSTTKPNMVVKYDFPKSWVLGHPFLFTYYKLLGTYQNFVAQRFWLYPEFYFFVFILYLIISVNKIIIRIYKFLAVRFLALLILFLIIIEPFLLVLGRKTIAEKISVYIWLLMLFYVLNYFVELDCVFRKYNRFESSVFNYFKKVFFKYKTRPFS